MSELKQTYRDHQIEVSKEECQGGWPMIYYSIFTPDGCEVVCDFTEDESPLQTHMQWMKERIDDELASKDPWGLKAELSA